MKSCNVIKSFSSGWVVGLSDNNHVLVETPEGVILQPYEGPGHKMFGTSIDNATIPIQTEAAALVRKLWDKKRQADEQALAQDSDVIEEIARELTGEDTGAPSLDDLGFDNDDSVHVEEI